MCSQGDASTERKFENMKQNFTKSIYELDEELLAHTYARFPVNIVSGKDVFLYDEFHNEYLDFTSGIGVNSIGYADAGYVDAVQNQLMNLAHISNLFYTNPQVELAERLINKSKMRNVFFANSGTEANEAAIKVARKYAHERYQGSRDEIISLVSSFHGRSMGSLSATGQDVLHPAYFAPYLNGFVFAKANDWSVLADKISDRTAAIMIELIQGESGVNVLCETFVKKIASICKERDILLIVDEVQSGIGRTGKFLACEHYGIEPDILTLAKGLGGGLPIGAMLLGEKTKDTLAAGDHGSTFGGNPVSCAAAKYVLEKMDAGFLKEVEEKGEYMKHKLANMQGVAEVTGMGLMLGIELNESCFANGRTLRDIILSCIQHGLLVLSAKHKLRVLPPLTIQYSQMDRGLEILREVLLG